jgi:hypothetical protein
MAKDLRNKILDVSSEDLPNEILLEILSYFSKKERLNNSMVNQRWFQNINSQIEDIQIRRPTTTNENLEELQKLIDRFLRLRSLIRQQVRQLFGDSPLEVIEFKRKIYQV